MPLTRYYENEIFLLWSSLKLRHQSNHENNIRKYYLKDVPQNTYSVIFRAIKVIKNKDSLRKCCKGDVSTKCNMVS